MVSDADITDLVKRLVDLERRVAMIEAGAATRPSTACPKCGGQMRLTDENPHPTMGIVGLKVRTFTCDACGKTVTRDYDPAKG